MKGPETAFQRVAKSEAMFRALFAQAPLGVALVEAPTGRILESNARFAAIVGQSREGAPPAAWGGVVHPEDAEAYGRQWERLNAGEIPGFQMDLRCLRPDGSTVWVSATLAPLGGAPEPRAWHLCMLEDITARHLAEVRLEDTLQRLQLATDAASIGTWSWDLRENRGEWDDRLREWYEQPEDAHRAGLDFDFWKSRVHPDDVERAEALLLEARRRGIPYDHEFRVVRSDGSIRHIHAASVLEKDALARPVRMIGIHRDITRQVEMETRLRAAKQAAEAASRAKSDFLANMSHEIRTPMNAVIGMTDLLLDTPLGEQQRCYVETIRRSGEALLTLLNDILDLSKIEAGKLELESVDFDLADLLNDVAAPWALRAQAKGLGFLCAAAPDVPTQLRGDPARLRQILANLVSNAVKFTDDGEVDVRVELAGEPAADEVSAASGESGTATREIPVLLVFKVRDTGIGIDPADRSKLFRKFSQADASTTRRYGGTGLGLAIAKELVERMGGDVDVTSAPGVGSEFRFTVRLARQPESQPRGLPGTVGTKPPRPAASLEAVSVLLDRPGPGAPAPVPVATVEGPARAPEECPVAGPASPGPGPTPDPGGGSPPSREPAASAPRRRPLVLVVDDGVDNLRLVGSILREDDVEVANATSGAEALAFVREEPPDLILLDVMMPGMDGYETCRQIKKRLASSAIPVIFLSARTQTEDVVRGFEAGGVDYVAKPFRPAELRARIRTQLQLHRLKGLLSICMYCHRIEESPNHWERIDSYFARHTPTHFSHGMCPRCLQEHASELGLTPEEAAAIAARIEPVGKRSPTP